MQSQNNLIYFNTNKSTKTDPQVIQTMQTWARSSVEQQKAMEDSAVLSIAALLNAKTEELIFTSGTSESITLLLKSVFEISTNPTPHFICSNTEHPVVLDTLLQLEKGGAELSFLRVNREGLIDVDELKQLVRPNTAMVCVMAANNETGVIQPIEAVSNICDEKGILFFSDASQYIGKMRYDSTEIVIDALAFGAHKMYGPKGIGLLYVSNKNKLLQDYIKNNYAKPFEGALKVGFGKAAELFQENFWDTNEHISRLKNYFEHQLLDIEGLRINGSTRYRLYNTSNLYFPSSLNIVSLLKEFEFAHNLNKTSHVLKAMGLTEEEIQCSYRFSFGKDNQLEEVKNLVNKILKLRVIGNQKQSS